LTIDLSHLAGKDYMQAAERWSEATGEMAGFNSLQRRLQFCKTVQVTKERSVTLRIDVFEPDLQMFIHLELVVGTADFCGSYSYLMIPVNSAPADGDTLLALLLNHVPQKSEEIDAMALSIAEFWDQWLACVDPVSERSDIQDIIDYDS
jgi:hypothetical protein